MSSDPYAPHVPNAALHTQLLDALRGAGVPILDVATEQPDLEDVFVELTRP